MASVLVLQAVKDACPGPGVVGHQELFLALGFSPSPLNYDCLIDMIEHLKGSLDIATMRISNWQRFCNQDDTVLPFLIHATLILDEGVAPIILHLLQCALCGAKAVQQVSVAYPE